jgi:hypothetical protein
MSCVVELVDYWHFAESDCMRRDFWRSDWDDMYKLGPYGIRHTGRLMWQGQEVKWQAWRLTFAS